MSSRRPPIMHGAPAPRGGRLPSSSLPPHLADIRLPSGARLGQLSSADVARLCIVLQIPGASHTCGKQQNAELLSSVLEAIGRDAAEKAIAAHLSAKLGSGG